MRKLLAVVLAMAMALSLGVTAHADEHETEIGIGQQIAFIAAQFKTLRQNDDESVWYYAVTDLDHNGRLELLANTKNGKGIPKLKAWEFSPDGKSMIISTRQVIPAPVGSEEKSLIVDSMMLNLRSNSVDTHYDPETDTYYYSFVDATEINGFVLPGKETDFIKVDSGSVMTGVGAVSMKNGLVAPSIILGSCISYSVDDGDLKVLCFNGKAEEITLEEFLSLSLRAFPDLPRFNTAFDWFAADEATVLERFVKSYATFAGVLDEDHDEGGVELTASQSAGGVYITKNPTDEKHNAGEKAIFVAGANVYDQVTWTFVAPDGRTCNEQEFVRNCGGIPELADGGAKLRIKDVNTDMNGWGVFATFDYRGASARTATAYLYVWAGSSAGGNAGSSVNATLDDFYSAKAYLNSEWFCPMCSNVAYGSQCSSCGFNPVSYYSVYYGVTPDSCGWYYGVNGQTPVAELTPDPFVGVLAWICPACGESTQNSTICWNCGYHYGDPVGYDYYDYVGDNTIREAIMGADLRQCQYCGNYFNSDYDVCPYCGSEPNDGTEIAYDTWMNTVQEMYQGATLRQCQYCGNYFNNDYDVCPYCGGAPDDGSYDVGTFSGYTPGGNERYTHYDEYGNEYDTVICPVCGTEHSMATNCPVCGAGYG